MTWSEATTKFRQGTGGAYLVEFAAGRVIAGKLPWVLRLVLSVLGIALPPNAVVMVKGALKLPFKRSWLAAFVALGGDLPVWSEQGDPANGRWIGPAGERQRMVEALRRGTA